MSKIKILEIIVHKYDELGHLNGVVETTRCNATFPNRKAVENYRKVLRDSMKKKYGYNVQITFTTTEALDMNNITDYKPKEDIYKQVKQPIT